MYPTVSPITAARKRTGIRMKILRYPCDESIPAVKSKLSPGRKNPIRSPVSAKIMPKSAIRAMSWPEPCTKCSTLKISGIRNSIRN